MNITGITPSYPTKLLSIKSIMIFQVVYKIESSEVKTNIATNLSKSELQSQVRKLGKISNIRIRELTGRVLLSDVDEYLIDKSKVK